MDLLFALTTCAFFIWTVRNVLYITAVLSDNDYRFGRLFLYLRETAQGKSILFSLLSFVKWVAIIFYFFVIFQEQYIRYFHFLVFSIYIVQAVLVLRDLFLHPFKLPVFSIFTRVIIFFTLVSSIFLYSVPLLDAYFWILIIDRMIPILVALYVFLFSFPKEIYEDVQIQKAIKKIKKHKDLMVIGITGSYGKTSTKEFLFQILQKDFVVVRSSGGSNSLFEIAQTINKELTSRTQILILEMDAYQEGDIRKISHIVKPNIGIMTGINDQYLALIGDRQKSALIKYELIESLPRRGFALFNGNDTTTYALFKKTKKQKIAYWNNYESVKSGGENVYAKNIIMSEKTLEFDAKLPNKEIHLYAPLFGNHNIENILPAVYLGHYFGIEDKVIQRVVKNITPLSHSLELKKASNGAFFLDDTLLSNPASVNAGIEYIKIFKKQKIVVLEPMLNLGKNANKEHEKIARKIAAHCDYLLTTNKNYNQEIVKGVRAAKTGCKLMQLNPRGIKKFLKRNVKRGDVVLFEGEETQYILNNLR